MTESSSITHPYRKIFAPGETTEVKATTRPLVYCWQKDVVLALNVALATRRALLLKGEPGIGKSTIAEAAAAALNWRYYRHVVTSRTEAQDLTWRFDYVRRLADAHSSKQSGDDLDDTKYLIPGPFWWAFDPITARKKGGAHDISDPFPGNAQRNPKGAVVLIDEIDKADPAVANDLLETLGNGRFRVDGIRKPFDVEWTLSDSDGQPKEGGMLVVFTSNDERDLPPAFIRRCVVMEMKWPQTDGNEREEFNQFLRDVATENWLRITKADPVDPHTSDAVDLINQVIKLIWEQRREHGIKGMRPPGLAEFLDALAACRELSVQPGSEIWNLLEQLVWRKQ